MTRVKGGNPMNENRIVTHNWSNKESEILMRNCWPDEPELCKQQSQGYGQCGGCSFFAKLNRDWGLCCHAKSRHHLETISEHFTCASYVGESWDAHSFSENEDDHCFCHELFSPPRGGTEEEKEEQREDWRNTVEDLRSRGVQLPRDLK